MLQELDTVTSLIEKNGALAGADVYDGYGKVKIRDYSPGDFDRDGDVDATDLTTFNAALLAGGANKSTPDPMSDLDGDGDTDLTDAAAFTVIKNAGGTVAQRYVSSIGNPFFFTGRRLYMLETLPEGASVIQANQQLQHNRARHYSPMEGRWLQRDPAAYVDGISLYQYLQSQPLLASDPRGLFKTKYHTEINEFVLTMFFETEWCWRKIIEGNDWVDWSIAILEPKRHFDDEEFEGGLEIISREESIASGFDRHVQCCNRDAMEGALRAFGRLLHTAQDFYAHSNWVEHYGNDPWPPRWDRKVPDWLTSGYWPDWSTPSDKVAHGELNKDEPDSISGRVHYGIGTGHEIAKMLAKVETHARSTDFKGYAPLTYKCCNPRKYGTTP